MTRGITAMRSVGDFSDLDAIAGGGDMGAFTEHEGCTVVVSIGDVLVGPVGTVDISLEQNVGSPHFL